MKRPLVERLREIRDRLDLIGDEGDTETIDEAIERSEAYERLIAEHGQTQLGEDIFPTDTTVSVAGVARE